ncbi:Ubiquitin elongating factor core family protein [Theileria parva strain Muguga]|uniref:Ubiquitin elongating factor core family protein n=1 Tax=Theileria parva strain Muguga TaxID=333668 RepID=UPI001C61D3DE|nr:Ubiquitin elongating factor core family protein [Theileria parva strain Muguga]KAF5153450.1 Ubiquitin elongating factor core family protein [Theileria parva strain Muguga]
MTQNVNKPTIIHKLIQNSLNVTIKKSERQQNLLNQPEHPRHYVGHLYGRISGITDTENKYLNVEDLDDVVRSIVYLSILHNKNVLVDLNDSYTRTANEISKINKSGVNNEILGSLNENTNSTGSLKSELLLVLEKVQSFLISNASILMSFPEYFTITDIISENEIKKAYLNVSDERVLFEMFLDYGTSTHNVTFLQKLVAEMWETDENVSKEVFINIFGSLRKRLILRTLKSNASSEAKLLTELFAYKPLVELFLYNVVPVELYHEMGLSSGVKIELTSFFGRFLGVTTLDEEQYEVSKLLGIKQLYEGAKVDRTSDFYGKKDLNHLKSVFNSKRFESEHSMNNFVQLVKVILKVDSRVRNRFLSVMGRFISFNTNRKKMYGLTHIETPPISFDEMYFRRLVLLPDNSFGFCVNFTWLLLLLAQGITIPKSDEIDPSYCQAVNLINQELEGLENESNEDSEAVADKVQDLGEMEKEMNKILGFLATASCMGDENQVKSSLKLLKSNPSDLYNSKFITQIFWLTLKSLNMMFLPSLQENLKILNKTLEYANSSSNLGINDDKLANYISYVYVWRTALQHPSLLKALWHYVHISFRLFLRCFLLYDKEGNVKSDYKGLYDTSSNKFGPMVEKYCDKVLTADAGVSSPQFTVLPVDLIENVLDLIKNMTILKHYDHYIKPNDTDPLEFMDFELVVTVCIFIMKCPNNVIKNIHIKCDMACSTILYLCKFSKDSVSRFETINVCKLHLMDALVRTFISSQKSNYNTRISSRLNIIQSFTQFFVLESYRKNFVTCIISKKDLFIQFMHLLLNDTNFLIEEVVSYLTEIRRREIAGISLDEAATEDQQSGENNENAEDQYVQEGAIDANQLRSMAGPELKGRTRSFVEYGFEICLLLHILCSEFPSDITSSSVLLPQVVTCLGCCLESLAGPKCLQLKVKNMDEYGFKPKEWLSKIMQCYISLYEHNDSDEVTPFVKAVVNDERYYKPEIFNRCIRFSTREMFLNYRNIKSFNNLSNKLLEYAKQTSMLYDNAVTDEIPENYLDPIMMDIMEDPVLLPTSGKIMDRKNIERHLMSESTDPFTRAPLERDQLIEQPELKEEISTFLKSLIKSNSTST